MSFGFDVAGMIELRARLNGMKERAANLKPGLIRAGMVVLKAAKDHIKSGSGDDGAWAPNQTGTPLLFKSGRLINSLTIGAPGDVFEVSDDSVTVGTNVFYAQWMQEGTGIYGPTGKRIFPLTASALAWPGGHVFRSIAGSPQRRFLFIDEAQAETIRSVFAAYILNGVPANDP